MLRQEKTVENQRERPWSLESDGAYLRWRTAKIEGYEDALNAPVLRLKNLAAPSEAERKQLSLRCRKTNLALYETDSGGQDFPEIRAGLRSFADALGLQIAEKHRSAGEHGIVALRVTDAQKQRGYIPYSHRPMNWHTDGYYNAKDEQIRAMVLHCVTPADDGGMNQFLDPEIVYIRLRDTNPAFIRTLMHPEAMTIPENREADGSLRPASTGPVFSVGADGNLAMRYTARTRSIRWRQDEATTKATDALTRVLASEDPFKLTLRLKPGQGILCNNILHNRTGFDPGKSQQSKRLVFRIRFHNRVKGS